MFRSAADTVESYIKRNQFTTLDQNGSFCIVEYPPDPSMPPCMGTPDQLVCKLSHPVLFRKGADKIAKGEVSFCSDLQHNHFGGSYAIASASWQDVCLGSQGKGFLVITPSCRRLLLLNLEDWGRDVMLDASLFLACDGSLTLKSLSSSQRFMHISGRGTLCIMTDFSPSALTRETLSRRNTCQIDGNRAMLWSYSLDWTFRGDGSGIDFVGPGQLLIAPRNTLKS